MAFCSWAIWKYILYVFLWETTNSDNISQKSGEVQTKARARKGESPCLISCHELGQGCHGANDDDADADAHDSDGDDDDDDGGGDDGDDEDGANDDDDDANAHDGDGDWLYLFPI